MNVGVLSKLITYLLIMKMKFESEVFVAGF